MEPPGHLAQPEAWRLYPFPQSLTYQIIPKRPIVPGPQQQAVVYRVYTLVYRMSLDLWPCAHCTGVPSAVCQLGPVCRL